MMRAANFCFLMFCQEKYRLEVKHISEEAVSKDDKWCWEQSFIDVDVGAEDIKGIEFIQKGYWVNVVSTHDVDAYMTQQDRSPVNLKIKKGSQYICVESPGVHALHFVNSCILFGSSSMKIDTSNSLPIYLKGEKYFLSGQINVNSSSSNELPVGIVVDILNGEGTVIHSTNAKLASSAKDQIRTAVYEYSIIAGEEGSIASVKKGGVVLETATEADGSFVAGPLYDDITYNIKASKPGFHLKQVGLYSFSCQKLSQISVKIYSKDDATEPIPSLLLSLSGDDGYWNNSMSGTGGIFVFANLFPGSFYLRPLLKKDGLGSAKIERASPESVAVKVGNKDIKGLDFLVFEEPEMTILSDHVEENRVGELHSNLLVEIKSAGDMSKVESVFQLPLSNFFQVKDLPRGKHIVQLKFSLPSSTHKFESEIIEFDVGPLRYSVEEDHHK
ncbi:hypothetical protein CRYUN_Cryun01aG0197400 [Craigia yunnanensis]